MPIADCRLPIGEFDFAATDLLHDLISIVPAHRRSQREHVKKNRAERELVPKSGYELRTLRVQRKGRNLRSGEVEGWTREYFENLGLHRLRGTICYPAQPFWTKAA